MFISKSEKDELRAELRFMASDLDGVRARVDGLAKAADTAGEIMQKLIARDEELGVKLDEIAEYNATADARVSGVMQSQAALSGDLENLSQRVELGKIGDCARAADLEACHSADAGIVKGVAELEKMMKVLDARLWFVGECLTKLTDWLGVDVVVGEGGAVLFEKKAVTKKGRGHVKNVKA